MTGFLISLIVGGLCSLSSRFKAQERIDERKKAEAYDRESAEIRLQCIRDECASLERYLNKQQCARWELYDAILYLYPKSMPQTCLAFGELEKKIKLEKFSEMCYRRQYWASKGVHYKNTEEPPAIPPEDDFSNFDKVRQSYTLAELCHDYIVRMANLSYESKKRDRCTTDAPRCISGMSQEARDRMMREWKRTHPWANVGYDAQEVTCRDALDFRLS